ncbi:hypothetical protein Goklo_027809 [Gossypium klotzschianum]|uniref:phosphoglycerate mutase (2,3-diphosphoglycerate-dependent) n=1 Tax=Gossypium klotzschianum TaxID=34286 RepID=A0A7J8TZE1_9ROSI|nr:hypothetical protein [Gossypium klotzschianum]
MATAMFHKSIATIQLNSSGNGWSTCKKLRNYPLKIISKAFVVDVGGSFIYGQSKLHGVHALSSHSPLVDPVSSFSQNTNDYKNNTSVESALILNRHGDSLCNEKNLFTGCVDVPLTKKGFEEAVEAGRRISNIPVDMIYTSLLIRVQMTSMLVMTKHRHKKVPIIIHKENDQAKEWSQVFSEETKRQSIPVITAWELNERMYIKFHFSLLETAQRYGKEKVHEWRRLYDSPPANGESLKMCSQRAVAYFREHVSAPPWFKANVLIMLKVTSLELSTGIPLLYIYKEGEFLRRGSPVGSKEASVYAYSKETTNRRVVVGFLAVYGALADLYVNW